jgi:hypothetical protein
VNAIVRGDAEETDCDLKWLGISPRRRDSRRRTASVEDIVAM